MQHVYLLLSTLLFCLLTAPASWGQTYNPTASDPVTWNTAGGTGALPSNSGFANTAFGLDALGSNTTGYSNTASGVYALVSNTTGGENTASGFAALFRNTTGEVNTALGSQALESNTTGFANTASGAYALGDNTTGTDNTATGIAALIFNTTGQRNTASGFQALANNTTGFRNTAFGWGAGSFLTSGSNNLYLGHPGVVSESNTMRLGSSTHTRAFMAGVAGVSVKGSHVLITNTGQLGVLASSARYKQDIQPMGEQGQKLQQLRPVTFSYKEDITATRQYGLIAEEVAKIYPELVIRNDDGGIEGVHYEALTPLLLHQVQQQQLEMTALKAQLLELQRMVTKR